MGRTTVKAGADRAGVSQKRIRDWIYMEALPARWEVGGQINFKIRDLDRVVAAWRQGKPLKRKRRRKSLPVRPPYITVRDAAIRTGISEGTIRKWYRMKLLPIQRSIPGQIIFLIRDLDKLVKQKTGQQPRR